MATISDIIEGASATRDKSGISCTRVFIVDDLSGNEHSRMIDALNVSGIPVRGDAHPNSSAYRVDTVNAVPLSMTKARVTVTYKPWTQSRFEPNDTQDPSVVVGASLVEVESNLDYQDNLITVEYAGELDQVAKIRKTVVVLTLRLTRRETSSPRAKAQQYTNKVNQTPWLGDPARSWLCKSIEGNSDDGGESYMVTYEFQRKLPNWDVTVGWIDPATDQVPYYAVEGNGLNTVRIYDTTNFSGLNLGNF